jgi:1A family penicillin-binding protein
MILAWITIWCQEAISPFCCHFHVAPSGFSRPIGVCSQSRIVFRYSSVGYVVVSRKRIIVVTVLVLIAGLILVVRDLVTDLPDPRTLLSRAPSGTTKLLDRNGRLLYEFLDPRSEGGSRTRVDLAQVPLACRQATLATEDASFYTNSGFDLRGILRAAWLDVANQGIVSGGSTLTQQLARVAFLSEDERTEKSLRRKLREVILAFQMSQMWSKDTIFEAYLNEIYYGELAYGIEAAAQTYFGLSVSQLDLAQCTLLAGLPQRPAQYDPLVNLDAAKARQRVVLDLMARQGYITPEQADLAHAEPLKLVGHRGLAAPHFVVYVRNQLEDQLGAEALLRGGWVITTTLDLDLQRTAEEIVTRRLQDLRENDAHDAAVVVMDAHTGDILAMVGSADYADTTIDGAVNTATALRQPGSAMKPILYATAFMQDWVPSDVVYDVRTAFATDEGQTYVPANYDNQYHGPVSLRDALANSYNLPAVILQKKVGTDAFFRLARMMGLTTLTDPRRYGLTLTLGGGEVRLLDLTAAYAVFANGGYSVEPRAILELNQDVRGAGFTLSSSVVRPSSSDLVLDSRVAYLVTDILSDNRARTPSFGEFSPLRLSRPAAAKTGTTSNWRDNWTMGYTPDLVTGVWVGNADNHAMHNISGVAGAGPIWHDVMEVAHQQQPITTFARPAGIEEREVCVINGLTPGPDCPYRRTDLFLVETPQRPVEHEYVRVKQGGVERVTWIPPVELREWVAERTSLIFPFASRVPPFSPAGGERGDGGDRGITLTSPDPNTILTLDPHLPRDAQRIEVAAQVSTDAARVEFVADGQMWASVASAPYRAWWVIEPGQHRIQAVAVMQDGARIASEPVVVEVDTTEET